MSLAKRLEEMVREDRLTDNKAEEVLLIRRELWAGQQVDGQMLMVFGKQEEGDHVRVLA